MRPATFNSSPTRWKKHTRLRRVTPPPIPRATFSRTPRSQKGHTSYDKDGNLRSGNPSSDGWVILWQGMRQVTIGSGSTATQLYESESRFENPQLGTWISPDPKQYIDGMNYYQMEIGNPVSLLDPSGNGTFGRIVGGIIGAIGGGIAGGIVGGSIDGAIGAAGGSVVPGAGTVAGGAAGLSWGAMTGGAAGAAGGWKAGGAVGSRVENWIVSRMTGGSGSAGSGSGGSGSGGSSGKNCPQTNSNSAGSTASDANKLNHIFGNAQHGLDGIVKNLGSQQAAMNALQQATEAAVQQQGLTGVLKRRYKLPVKRLPFGATS